MSSEAIGVQKQIKKMCEKAVYTQRCGHNLNLVIAAVSKIPMIQNTLDIVKEATMMLVKVKFGKHNSLNPFLPNVSFLYILKTSGNKIFFNVFNGYKKGTLRRNGLKSGGK